MENVVTVPCDVGQRLGLLVVARPAREADPLRGQVAGAALRAPGPDERVLPGRVAAGRRGGRTVRVGPARGLPPQEAAPHQHVGVVDRAGPASCSCTRAAGGSAGGLAHAEDEAVGAVGQHEEGDGLAGRGPLEHVGEEEQGVGGAGDADRAELVVHDRLGPDPGALAHDAHRPGVEPGDDEVVDLLGRDARRLEGVAEGRLGERHVLGLAEALLPHLGREVAGDAPAVEELGRRRAGGDELGGNPARSGARPGRAPPRPPRRHRPARRRSRAGPPARRRPRGGWCDRPPRRRRPPAAPPTVVRTEPTAS